MPAAALPSAALQYPPNRVVEPREGVAGNRLDPSETKLLERADEVAPEALPAGAGLDRHGVERLINASTRSQDGGRNATHAEFRDPQMAVGNLAGEQPRPVVAPAAKALLAALMALGAEDSNELELAQLLQAVAHDLGVLPARNSASEEATRWIVDMALRLV